MCLLSPYGTRQEQVGGWMMYQCADIKEKHQVVCIREEGNINGERMCHGKIWRGTSERGHQAEGSISAIFGIGSRRRLNDTQVNRFDEFRALLQKSTT